MNNLELLSIRETNSWRNAIIHVMDWAIEWKQCKNILCVRLDNMGDVIMMTPAFRALKQSFPDAMITLLTSSVGGKTTPYIPDIDQTIMYDAPWIENPSITPSEQTIQTLVAILEIQKFDAAIIFTNFSQNPLPIAMMLYLAHIPRILGHCRELPYPFINYWVPDREPFIFPIHGVMRQLTLLSHIGVHARDVHLSLSIHDRVSKRMKERLQKQKIKQPFILLHPGASLKRRQYTSKSLVSAAQALIHELGYQIVLTGNMNEQKMVHQMALSIGDGAISLAGETTIEEFIALIQDAAIVISNNTAPVHIAAALQTPVVDLYARSNPEHTPWMVAHRLLYFDIPIEMRTQNTVLLSLLPEKETRMPQPEDIVQAVKELLLDMHTTKLSREITTWGGILSKVSKQHNQVQDASRAYMKQ